MKKANKPAKPAILPANKQDPTGVDRLERGAMRDFSRRLRKIGKGYIELLNRIPSEPAVNQRYTFRLDQTLLSMLLQNGESLVDDILLQGGELNLWFWQDYVSTAYQRGTAQEFSNLSQQSPAYAADRESIENILLSEAYQSRLILVRAREFEEMKGLSNQIKADLSRVLTDGIGRGLNPREVARNITAQTDIERSRANRIARTEITTALRRARWDEHDQAKDDLGLNVMLLHMSALSPTTRRTHALRHGHLYTSDEVREWYSINGNAINCYLPDTEVQGRFVAGSKSYYEGMVVKLVTRSGRNLTVTPNHSVMTDRGLIAANEVTERDNLFAYGSNVENPIRISDLHDQHRVSAIQDVFSSLVESGHSILRGVGAVDFHGDGSSCKGKVHIVRSDRQLTFACDTHMSKMLDYFALKHTDSVSALIHGASFSDLIAVDLSSSDDKGRSSDQSPFFRSRSREPVNGRSASSSALNSSGFESPLDGGAGYSNRPGDSLLRESGLIEIDDIVSVERYFFEGHVYDLEEVSGLMIANGIIASNCKCTQVTVLVDEKGVPLNSSVIDIAKKEFAHTWGKRMAANKSHHCCKHAA